MSRGRTSEFDPATVRDVSERVYRDLLESDSGEGAVQRMIGKDGDNGQKLRGRAAAYDRLTRSYMRAMGAGQ